MVNRMKCLFDGDNLVKTVLGAKKVMPNQSYRRSDFAVVHHCDGKKYLYNNFSKKLYLIDNELFDFDSAKRFSSEEVSADENLAQLVADRFLVPESTDEAAVYEGFCKIARTMKLKRNGYSRYTILPTTACNARCVYCYEAGIKYVTMSDEILDQTIEFIKKTRNPNKTVSFGWFGGEPLMGVKMIDKICAEMRKAEIPFNSTMISNGSLITEEIIKKMCADWNLKRIQITLDGLEEQYNARKNYVFHYESAYWHVLSRIKLINDNGIRLIIRINVDESNINDVLAMLEDVKLFIADPSLVSFNIAPLYDLQASENASGIWEKTFEISDEIRRQGFRVNSNYSVDRAKYTFCMADSPDSAVVVAPDGKLYHCEHIQEFEPIGDIWNGITDSSAVAKLRAVEPAREKCKGCFALPVCTTFSGCPNMHVDCKLSMRKRMERALDKMIRHFETEQAEIEDGDEAEESEIC